MKKNNILLITWVPVIIMMLMIFSFSASNGEQSSGLSNHFAQSIVDSFTGITDANLTPLEKAELIDKIHTPIRKFGHLTEYAVLGFVLSVPLYFYHKIRGRKLFLLGEMICFFYASTDEFHQLFVPGRTGKFTDVLIDSTGAAIGILVYFALSLLFYRGNRETM